MVSVPGPVRTGLLLPVGVPMVSKPESAGSLSVIVGSLLFVIKIRSSIVGTTGGSQFVGTCQLPLDKVPQFRISGWKCATTILLVVMAIEITFVRAMMSPVQPWKISGAYAMALSVTT